MKAIGFKSIAVLAVIASISFAACKNHADNTKSNDNGAENLHNEFFISEKNISDEWILFVYAQKAYSFKKSGDIVFGQNLYEYSAKLEDGIVSILNKRYNFNINNIDDFFSLSVDRYYKLKEEYKFIDIRIKYSIAAYGHVLNRMANYEIVAERMASSSAFFLCMDELIDLLGISHHLSLIHYKAEEY